MRTQREGFSLAELMIVILIIGILARIVMPTYQDLVYRARAAQALGDLNAIRVAAYAYNTETNEWPPDVNRGTIPPELEPYLRADFSFTREHYQIDWDNWMMPDGSPKHSSTDVLIGVSITTQDDRLGQALINLVGENTVQYTINEHYTFIIASA